MPPLKKNEKIMLAGIGVMIIVFIVMDPYYFIYKDPPVPEAATPVGAEKPGVRHTKPAATPPQKGTKPAKGGKGEPVAEPMVDNRPKREPIQFNQWGRDPFIQTKRSYDDQQAISGLKLGGISTKGADSYVLINKQILRVGDGIEGLIVSRIESDRVHLSKGGQTYILTGGQR